MLIQRLAAHVARWVVHRPKSVIFAALLLVALCAWILRSRQNFDTEVLNLLPQRFESVQALKVLNNDFAQARELIFALHGDREVVADFRDHFVEAVGKEPWSVRVFGGPPIESPEEIEALGKLVPLLLLNLEPAAFAENLKRLEPATIDSQIHRLRSQVEAGSALAEMQLTTDPLGMLGAALKPLAGTHGMEKGQALASADGTLAIVPVFTNQPSLSQPDCKALMEQVNEFIARVGKSWDGPVPKILVTGRSAYVAQISAAMEHDIQLTSTVSILAVAGLFYLAFRRLLPLLGIIVTLGISCFISFALGCLLFDNLNMVAIAFCSILVGLGDDFSLLLYNRYLHGRKAQLSHESAVAKAIADIGPGILYVSATTGIGFLVLLFSGSAGFAQLGTLVAIGIILCGVSMCTLLFVFIRSHQAELPRDPFAGGIRAFVRYALGRPDALAVSMLVLCTAAVLLAVLPIKPLRFDTSPRSLEPKQTAAAQALQLISDKVGGPTELVAVLVEADNAQQSHDRWEKLTQQLDSLVKRGELRSYSTPAALVLSPERIRRNQDTLQAANLGASRAALEQAIHREELNAEAFEPSFALLDGLAAAAKARFASVDLRALLPQRSAWAFLIDRYFSARPFVTVGYISPARPIETAEGQAALERQIKASGVPLRVTGWSYTMTSLVPWAKHELFVFSAGVGSLILLLLAFAYRRLAPWLIHTASLIFAFGATIASLKLLGVRVNMLNALAFPLVLGVGVDYGMHILFALREHGDREENITTVLKPLVISGFTTITGFGSLMLARNPALSGLGLVCALGISWCLIACVLFILPLSAWAARRRGAKAPHLGGK